jgi:hypothetical protein
MIGTDRTEISSKTKAPKSSTDSGVAGRNMVVAVLHSFRRGSRYSNRCQHLGGAAMSWASLKRQLFALRSAGVASLDGVIF